MSFSQINIEELHFNASVLLAIKDLLTIRPRSPGVTSRPFVNKVFIFVIDALRLDFVQNSESIKDRFPKLSNLLNQNATQSLLFGFRADPPTVTSQRLKALTTGSLPTFIDISLNFNSATIMEDNLIKQLQLHGKRSFFSCLMQQID